MSYKIVLKVNKLFEIEGFYIDFSFFDFKSIRC